MEILTKEQKDLLADFLDSLRDYERESHNLIGFDERETSEFVELYEGILCGRNNRADTESGLHLANVTQQRELLLLFQKDYNKRNFDDCLIAEQDIELFLKSNSG